MKYVYPFFNPLEWYKAIQFAKNTRYNKSASDLELLFYSKMLTNNMLHYGYFEDTEVAPETLSFKQIEDAQMTYAEKIVECVTDSKNPILDVGCGMGGLSRLLHLKRYRVEGLTPDKNQTAFIKNHDAHLTVHNCKFEEFEPVKKYGTVINSESLQYISLDDAIKKVWDLVVPGGRWIVADYFALREKGSRQRPHHLHTFCKKTKEAGWHILYERNITPNILPTLTFAEIYVNRFLLPAKELGYEKLRYKTPKLYYLTDKFRRYVDKKIKKELATIDPSIFKKERRYMMYVLEKSSSTD